MIGGLFCQSGRWKKQYRPALLSTNIHVINNQPDHDYAVCGADPGKQAGSVGWVVACGARTCQSMGNGYVSGIVTAWAGLDAQITCW